MKNGRFNDKIIEKDKTVENMYDSVSKSTLSAIKRIAAQGSDLAFADAHAIRKYYKPFDAPTAIRSNFIRDVDKILYCPYFSRYQDKTQVFSLYKNDDITRRWLHVQLVAETARTIGKALGLNLELIHAIALGHDIGHTPFGHAGERLLDKLYNERTRKHFYHNLNSVRVLKDIFPLNLTLQTLDGVLCHNGETESPVYEPEPINDFCEFERILDLYEAGDRSVLSKQPATLEGCVVKIADIIAYLGKDRQDAAKLSSVKEKHFFVTEIGSFNAEIINNLTINIIENSINKPYIKMSDEYFDALSIAKKENYNLIYRSPEKTRIINETLEPMFKKVYEKFYKDLLEGDRSSLIFTHHINYLNSQKLKRETPYGNEEPNKIVADYISSMTDDYFYDVYKKCFKNSEYKLEYKGYFD